MKSNFSKIQNQNSISNFLHYMNQSNQFMIRLSAEFYDNLPPIYTQPYGTVIFEP